MNKFAKITAVSAFSAVFAMGMAQAFADDAHGQKMDMKHMDMGAKADRTVEVKMFDNYFEPEMMSVKKGETVRFKIMNMGEFVHEFNVDTAEMHKKFQATMEQMMEHGAFTADKIDMHMMNMDMGNGQTMQHDAANRILLEPGKSGEVVWTFSDVNDVEFACNVPGHYDSGMVGHFSSK
jgi:uncharacterized cupredoxin-like copper-binding protein